MNKKIGLTLLAASILALSACTRSAAIPLAGNNTLAAPTSKANSVQGLNAVELSGTQTAAAKGTNVPSMPTLAVTGTPGTAVALSTNFPTPTNLAGVNPTNTSAVVGLPTATGNPQSAEPTKVATNRPAATSAPVANPGSYTIQLGEFPYCLARRFDVDPDALLAANGLADGQNLQAGTVLVIPAGSGGFPGLRSLMPHPDTWVVDPGDTIYSIACQYGDVNPLSIAAANGLTGNYDLTVGQILQIP